MEIDELITIGNLSKIPDKEGYFTLKKNGDFPEGYQDFREFFLIFKDHRVRFVDVEFSRTNPDKIEICDDFITRDVINSGGVELALAKEDVNSLRINQGQIPLGAREVIFQDKKIGILKDVFYNNAHDVLVVELLSGKEIMIPGVDRYIVEISKNKIEVKNIEDLLNL